jgi:putative PIN family toxin of toxin-antitoxin system
MSASGVRLRVAVDTNLFVSGTIFKRGNPYALLLAWRSGAFTLVIAERQREELTSVFSRPGIISHYNLPADDRTDLFLALDSVPTVEPSTVLPVQLRDANDEHILAAAMGGNADFLVTGDKDLLTIVGAPGLGKLKVVTVAEFLRVLTERARAEQGDPG